MKNKNTTSAASFERLVRRVMTCRQPDRDCPKLLCGHSIPCPWHTVVIDTTVEPAILHIPVTATAALQVRDTLADIGEAIHRA